MVASVLGEAEAVSETTRMAAVRVVGLLIVGGHKSLSMPWARTWRIKVGMEHVLEMRYQPRMPPAAAASLWAIIDSRGV